MDKWIVMLRNYRVQSSKAQLPNSFIYRNPAKIYNFNIKCRIPHCRKYKITVLFIHYLQSLLIFFPWGCIIRTITKVWWKELITRVNILLTQKDDKWVQYVWNGGQQPCDWTGRNGCVIYSFPWSWNSIVHTSKGTKSIS